MLFTSSHLPHPIGNTPLVPIRKLVKPHKINSSLCKIHAKCEFSNPSGSIWDRRVSHEMNQELGSCSAFITGGISDLCVSLAWAKAATPTGNDLSITVLPGPNLEDCKLQLLHGFGANVVLSYQQDPDLRNTAQFLEKHLKNYEHITKTPHHRILPFAQEIQQESSEVDTGSPYNTLVEEVGIPEQKWDMIVCSGQDKCLLQSLRKRYSSAEETLIIGVDFTGNTFTEVLTDPSGENIPGIKTVHVPDAECYDMTRRMIREEGLLVGPISGGVMAAAIKEILSFTSTPPPPSILVILPDSLQNTSRDFLSTDWMLEKGYYTASHLESLYWWYDMAIENMSPPEVFIAPPEASITNVLSGMTTSSTERCVVVTSISAENKRVIGVITREVLEAKKEEPITVGDACSKQFGIIDSKAKFSDLERLLQNHNWVVNMHHVPFYTTTEAGQLVQQTLEDVLGAVNMADFVHYKRKVEKHHLSEFGIAMSDGIPSDVWLERFNEQIKISEPK